MTQDSPAFSANTITSSSALEIVREAIAAADALGLAATVAVCDAHGTLKALARMDGAPLMSVEVAQDKAYTAVGFGMRSDQWYEILRQDEPLRLGASSIRRLVPFGGGFPIDAGGAVIGGLGISGGHYAQDMQIAEAALRAVGLAPSALPTPADATQSADGDAA